MSSMNRTYNKGLCIYIYTYIRELLVDTVAQLVERMLIAQRACVRIQASLRFLIFSVAFFLLCYPGEALDVLISTVVCII